MLSAPRQIADLLRWYTFGARHMLGGLLLLAQLGVLSACSNVQPHSASVLSLAAFDLRLADDSQTLPLALQQPLSQPQPNSLQQTSSPAQHSLTLSPKQAIEQLPHYDLLAVDDEVIAYVGQYVRQSMPRLQRARMLHTVLHSQAFLGIEYESRFTGTAAQVLYQSSANCIGFANVYISLARHFGLDARYQLIENHPQWSRLGNIVLKEVHINTEVKLSLRRSLVVDINGNSNNSQGRPKTLSDSQAEALFYNNLAIGALNRKATLEAYKLWAKAITLAPDMGLLWSNVGLVFRQNKQYAAADQAYKVALTIDGNSYAALTNLAALSQHRQNWSDYDYYLDRIRILRMRNPYYHFHLAQRAEQSEDFSAAIDHINAAIDLKSNEADFAQLLQRVSI